jgi:trypsin-like peptidase
MPKAHDVKTDAVVTVGEGGRGFIIEHDRRRLIVTAAHCLPTDENGCVRLPPANSAAFDYEQTYTNLLARLGESPTIATQCEFVDPVADIAVLSEPDGQVPELHGSWEAFVSLTDAATALRVFELPEQAIGNWRVAKQDSKVRAWLLALSGRWFRCMVGSPAGRALWIEDAAEEIAGGMSGSPILDDRGRAIGVVAVGARLDGGQSTAGGPNPYLVSALPGWLLRSRRNG